MDFTCSCQSPNKTLIVEFTGNIVFGLGDIDLIIFPLPE